MVLHINYLVHGHKISDIIDTIVLKNDTINKKVHMFYFKRKLYLQLTWDINTNSI